MNKQWLQTSIHTCTLSPEVDPYGTTSFSWFLSTISCHLFPFCSFVSQPQLTDLSFLHLFQMIRPDPGQPHPRPGQMTIPYRESDASIGAVRQASPPTQPDSSGCCLKTSQRSTCQSPDLTTLPCLCLDGLLHEKVP